MNSALVILFLAFLGQAYSKAVDSKDDVGLTSSEANDFMTPMSRAKRGLYHECYQESPCSFEEVEEVLGRNENAYEYYYTFTCNKYQKNCKKRCVHRKDCSFGQWGSWNGAGNTECYKQTRSKPYNHGIQVKNQRWNCNGLHTWCPASPLESRMYCVCKKALCSRGLWSAWSGAIPKGKCASQKREQSYDVSWTTEVQIGSCDDVSKKCSAPVVDFRQRCSCKKAVCSISSWTTWSGSVNQGQCGTQTRTRSYEKSFVYEERSDCKDVSQSCPAPTTEKRDFCSCKYATCELREWSEWNPKVLESGSCGQSQSRKKTYEMSLAYQNHVNKCPSLPQKCPDDVVESRQQCMCAYRESCDLQQWTGWSEDVTEEGCKIQTRTRSYVSALKHAQGESCKGLNTECIEEPKQTRTYCKCKHVNCELGDWSEWSALDVSSGSCGEQTRTQSYNGEEVFTNKVGDCNGLTTICPADKQEKRSMCKCKTVDCEVGGWGSWTGDIPLDTCAVQGRKKSITVTDKLQYQGNSCDGLKTSCGEAPKETRKMCNCSYREDCTLKEWGAWNGAVPEVGCSVQIRTREYNKTIINVERESCSGLDVCPVIRDETRSKCNCNEVLCDWSDWFHASYDPKTKCYDDVRVKNKTAGTKKIEKFGSCDGINTFCSSEVVEKQQDCVSGGGGHVIVTSAPPVTEQPTPVPTTAFEPATYVSVGCFADHGKAPRPLPLLYLNVRSNIDWYNMKKTVQKCAEDAKIKRFEYFGVQFYGECWGGPNTENYTRDGPSDKCWSGVGLQKANAVYRLEDLPACSKELEFNAQVSSGGVDKGSWCAGSADKYQWIVVDLKKPMKISGIGTQGGNKDSWVTLYSLEYSEEGETWIPYKEGEEPKVFAGNSDRFTLETHWMKSTVDAQFLRFKPQSWSSTHVCMKIRVYGCES